MGKDETQATGNLKAARMQARPAKIFMEEPEAETWLNKEYTEQGADIVPRNLANRSARGCDGIPGDIKKQENGQYAR